MKKTITMYVEENPITGELVDGDFSHDFPAKFEVCDTCRGTGSTYLGFASRDQPAFTSDDFNREGPDFLEDYMSGRYDAPCPECKGKRVTLEIEEDFLSADDKLAYASYQEYLQEEADHYAEMEAERRMGC